MQLTKYCPTIDILKLCHGGQEGIDAIKTLHPDIVFLDIEMPKVNGFDVLDATKLLSYKVIFTTAYDQFAIKAFKYCVIDYLLKPIDIEELRSAIDRVSKEEKEENMQSKMAKLFDIFGSKAKSKLVLPSGEGYELVPYTDIIRCESDSNYTMVFLTNGKKIVLSKTLKEVEDTIQSEAFFRIHHSHYINTDHISKIYKTDGGYIVMTDGSKLNISRAKKEEFFNFFK
jgi:two-component system LytT family response regulator